MNENQSSTSQENLQIILKDFKHDAVLEKVQKNAVWLAQNQTQELINAYKRMDSTFQGRYIASDMMKEVFKDYRQSPAHRNQYNNAVHNSAAALAAKHFEQMLEESSVDGKKRVVFLTGSPGAGKTSAVINNGQLDEDIKVIFEGQLANAPQNPAIMEKIQQAIDKGYQVEIIAINPLPEQALDNTFKRYYDPEDGRGAPIATMARIQGNTYEGLKYLHNQFGDKLTLSIVDKPEGNHSIKTYNGWEHLAVLQSQGTEQQITQRLENRLIKQYQQGVIDYDCFKQAAGSEQRARQLSEVVSSRVRVEQLQDGDGRGISQNGSETINLWGSGHSSAHRGRDQKKSATEELGSPNPTEPLSPLSEPEYGKNLNKNNKFERLEFTFGSTEKKLNTLAPAPANTPVKPDEKTIGVFDLQYVFTHFNTNSEYEEVKQNTFQRLFNRNEFIFEHKKDKSRITINKNKIVCDNTDQNIRAALDIAQDKGWDVIKITGGSKTAKAEMWFQAHMRGLETIGYQPTEADKKRLLGAQERMQKEKGKSLAEALDIKPRQPSPQEKEADHASSQKKQERSEQIVNNEQSIQAAKLEILNEINNVMPLNEQEYNDLDKEITKQLTHVIKKGGTENLKKITEDMKKNLPMAKQELEHAAKSEQEKAKKEAELAAIPSKGEKETAKPIKQFKEIKSKTERER